MRTLVEWGTQDNPEPIDREIYVKAEDFLKVLHSLPDKDFVIKSIADNALRWECGVAKGHMTLISGDQDGGINIPVPEYSDPIPDDSINRDFGEGLELGGLACGSMAMRTVGLEGIQLKNGNGKAYAYSCDMYSLASCCLGNAIQLPQPRDDNDPYAGMITLKPDAADLLSALVKRDGEACLASNTSSVYCVTQMVELLLNQGAPLRDTSGRAHDLAQSLRNFSGTEIKVPLFREVVSDFLKRVEALTDDRQKAMVDIAVTGGKTSLSFNEIAGSTEEYYLVEGPQTIDVPSVRLEAHRVAKALEHATDMVFDYASHGNLILRGPKEFIFGIVGRTNS